MNIMIEKKALETMLFGILSCQCPVTEETERELILELRNSSSEELLPLKPFMEIADRNPEKTPLHVFMEFCFFGKSDPRNFTMTHDDAVRYFSSRYHFDRILACVNPLTINDPSGHMVGHMLTPVKINNGDTSADFFFNGKTIRIKGLFCPSEIISGTDSWLGLHLGMAITTLSDEQADMAMAHLGTIKEFADMAGRTDAIDYADYQSFGDYRSHIKARYDRNF